MNPNGKPKTLHQIDGQMMTVDEIAAMLGVTKKALYSRRSRMGGASYQLIVNMYRENQLGNSRDRAPRYLVEGQWMTRRQIADMLGVKAKTLSSWRWQTGGSMGEAIAYYRQYQTGEKKRYGNGGGREPNKYRVGNREYTVAGVAKKYGVCKQSVQHYLQNHGKNMAATLKHYREREQRKKRKAEKDIMKILGF